MGFGYAIYFVERNKNRVVRWDPDSGDVDVVAGDSKADEPEQTLKEPYGLILDARGSLLVADKLHNRVCRIDQGRLTALQLTDPAGSRTGHSDSPRNYDPRLRTPTGLFAEEKNSVLCTFSDDHTIYRIHESGELEHLLGVLPNRK